VAEPRRPVARKKLLIVGVALVAAVMGAAVAIFYPGTHDHTKGYAGGVAALAAVMAAVASSAQRWRQSKENKHG
jgi:peptidoglycan/LPS O-acetylase OafA/YrhL